MKKTPKIHAKMKFGEITADYPKTAEIFFKYGLHCVGCHVAPFETIEEGVAVHGLSKAEMEKLISELNQVIK